MQVFESLIRLRLVLLQALLKGKQDFKVPLAEIEYLTNIDIVRQDSPRKPQRTGRGSSEN